MRGRHMARRFQRKATGRCKGARELQERWCFSGGSSGGVLGVSKRRGIEVLRSLGSKLPERGYCSLHFPGEIHMLVVDFGYEYQRVLLRPRVPGIRTGCPDAPSDGFVSHGGGRVIITLRAADRDRGCCDNVQDLLTSVNDLDKRSPDRRSASRVSWGNPDEVNPDENMCHASSGNGQGFWNGYTGGVRFPESFCRLWFVGLEATSSGSSEGARVEKSVDKLSVKEFRERAIQRWAPAPSPATIQGIPSLHIDPTSLYPPQYRPGADGMQRSQPAVQTWTSRC
ncbi:hypothetical protein CK203_072661 [Vitis vinifera]|uniref:Uncharacterized protein n=1 Tax=Vitis vinifera TaxID=29760 RepID=A0A438EYZ7_VITVI|nr:hypothetical protein CK203_072661 [Vitis vinifera]